MNCQKTEDARADRRGHPPFHLFHIFQLFYLKNERHFSSFFKVFIKYFYRVFLQKR